MKKLITLIKRRKYGVSFGASDGALGNGWQFTNTAWTVAGGRAIATPTLGAELFANGSFAADTSWTKGAAWTIGSDVATHASATSSNLTQAVATINKWYAIAFDIAALVNGFFAVVGGNTAVQIGHAHTTTGTKMNAVRATATTIGLRSSANTGSADNATAKEITTSDLFATKDFGITSANMRVMGALNLGTPLGICGWMDDYTNPLNYIIAYCIGSYIRLDKVVAGTPTNLIALNLPTTTPSLQLKGTRSGGNLLLDLFLDGAQVSTQQTVSDAGIVGNTRHGMFNTSASNSISAFSIR